MEVVGAGAVLPPGGRRCHRRSRKNQARQRRGQQRRAPYSVKKHVSAFFPIKQQNGSLYYKRLVPNGIFNTDSGMKHCLVVVVVHGWDMYRLNS